MRNQDIHRRGVPPALAEKRMLIPFAFLSLLCHTAALFSLLLFQRAPVPDRLPPVVFIDLQAVVSSAGQAGADPERAAPAPPDPQPAPARKVRQDTPRSSPSAPAKPERVRRPAVQAAPLQESPAAEQVLPAPPATEAAAFSEPAPNRATKSAPEVGPPVGRPAGTAATSPSPAGGAVVTGASAAEPGTRTGAARALYLEQVKKLIEERLDYPQMARKLGMQGSVHIRCRLSRDGAPVAAEVAAASPYPLLDQAALRAVARVGRFPAVPPEVAGEEVVLTIPLRFRLGKERAD